MNQAGEQIDFRSAVEGARLAKKSLAPDDPLPAPDEVFFGQTELQVTNETTLMASRRFISSGLAPLGFELCQWCPAWRRVSVWGPGTRRGALPVHTACFETLVDDPMYEHHWDQNFRIRPTGQSSHRAFPYFVMMTGRNSIAFGCSIF